MKINNKTKRTFGKILLDQIIAAKNFLMMKQSPRRFKTRSEKKPYVPGTIKLSAVSTAIKKDYGAILSRRERKELAKQQGVSFKAYYNHGR